MERIPFNDTFLPIRTFDYTIKVLRLGSLMPRNWRALGRLRTIELIAIILFLGITLYALVFASLATSSVAQSHSDPTIQVFAYHMPNQGWAPLTVYFSPFGSSSPNGAVVRYEWDLDGNGSLETDATSTNGYTHYNYVKPGQYTVVLRVTDEEGGTATDSVLVDVRHPAASSVDYWTVFNDSQVRRVDFIISQANWDRMWLDPWSKTKVEADVVVFGERVDAVALSMKGNASLDASGEKKSWKVDTDLFVEGQEYRNLKQLLFHNNFADPSMLREKMAYDMMRFAGLPSSHAAYVELYIDILEDGKPPIYWGVYSMVERLDRKYLANNFGRDSRDGNLYKADAWFEEGAADLAYYGQDIEDYPKPRGEVAYRLQTNLENPDYSDIINLCYVIDGVEYDSPEDFAVALEKVFNVESYLRYLAVILTNLNLDTYPYTGNNYFIYHNPTTDLFEFLPWDMNNSWGHFGGGANFPLFGEVENVGPLQYAPLFSKVFEVDQYRQDYMAYVDLLLRYWFNKENVTSLAEHWHDLIRPYLTKETGDKAFIGESAMYSLEEFNQDQINLISLTDGRNRFLSSAIAAELQRSP
jgi:spore coat protein H